MYLISRLNGNKLMIYTLLELRNLTLSYYFQVLGKNGIRGWLDGSAEKMNWLKLVRSTNYTHDVNVQHLLLAGQVWSHIVICFIR